MIVVNPVDMSAFTTKVGSDIEQLGARSETANAQLLESVNTAMQDMESKVDTLTVVNGEISTEVQAINAHTTSEIAGIQSGDKIKNIYRLLTTITEFIDIPAVNINKTRVVLNTSIGYGSGSGSSVVKSAHAYLYDETRVNIRSNGSAPIHVEVIEYE